MSRHATKGWTILVLIAMAGQAGAAMRTPSRAEIDGYFDIVRPYAAPAGDPKPAVSATLDEQCAADRAKNAASARQIPALTAYLRKLQSRGVSPRRLLPYYADQVRNAARAAATLSLDCAYAETRANGPALVRHFHTMMDGLPSQPSQAALSARSLDTLRTVIERRARLDAASNTLQLLTDNFQPGDADIDAATAQTAQVDAQHDVAAAQDDSYTKPYRLNAARQALYWRQISRVTPGK